MIGQKMHLEVLENYPELKNAPAALIGGLERNGLLLEAPKGQTLFVPGEACKGVPLLVQGKVRVLHPSRDGSEMFLYRLYTGELCAMTLLALYSGRPYQAEGVVEESIRALLVPPDYAVELLESVPRLRTKGFLSLSRQADRLIGRLEDLTHLNPVERLASRLLSGGPVLTTTHRELAEELDCSRETITRALSRLQGEGLIRSGRGRIEVLDTSRLEELVGTGSGFDDTM